MAFWDESVSSRCDLVCRYWIAWGLVGASIAKMRCV